MNREEHQIVLESLDDNTTNYGIIAEKYDLIYSKFWELVKEYKEENYLPKGKYHFQDDEFLTEIFCLGQR